MDASGDALPDGHGNWPIRWAKKIFELLLTLILSKIWKTVRLTNFNMWVVIPKVRIGYP